MDETWQKVGVEGIRGPDGDVTVAQLYVPNQGFGMNLDGPEWLIDRIIADHKLAQDAARYREAAENLLKASLAVYNEIMEFGEPVSSETFEWWQGAMNQVEALTPTPENVDAERE